MNYPTKQEKLRSQLKYTLDHTNSRKRGLGNHPGYWFLIIEEQLERHEAQAIYRELGLTEYTRSHHKMQFISELVKKVVRANGEASFLCHFCKKPLTIKKHRKNADMSGVSCQTCETGYYIAWEDGMVRREK